MGRGNSCFEKTLIYVSNTNLVHGRKKEKNMRTENLSTRIAQIASLTSCDGGGQDTTKIDTIRTPDEPPKNNELTTLLS